MSDFTIRTSTTPPATIKVQMDASQSVAEAVAAADAAAASEAAADLDAIQTAADRVQTGLDASATAADRVQTGLDRTAAEDAAADAAAALASSLKIDQNLADLDNATTARTNLGVPPTTRNINTGTGLTGGGNLSADRTISASIASQAEAEAGTSATVLMTPQRTEQHMVANAIGWGQTWQAPTRAANTSYQNTTGRPIMVSLRWAATGTDRLQASPDNATWVDVGANGAAATLPAFAVIPHTWYYRTNNTTGFVYWSELR